MATITKFEDLRCWQKARVYSNKEFIRFLDYSSASCTEVKSMTYLLLDLEYFPAQYLNQLQDEIEEVKASILAFIKYLRKNENRLS